MLINTKLKAQTVEMVDLLERQAGVSPELTHLEAANAPQMDQEKHMKSRLRRDRRDRRNTAMPLGLWRVTMW